MTIGVKLLSPRYGLTRAGRLKASLYLGLALINAINRLGRFERVSSYIWEDEPSNKVRELDLNFLTTNLDNVDVGEVIKGVKGESGAVKLTRGFRAVIGGELDNAKVSVFLTVYPSRGLSEALGFSGGPDIVLSVFGYVGESRVESFTALIRLVSRPEEVLRGFVDNFMAYLNYSISVRTALGFPITRPPLARFINWVRVSNGDDFRDITRSLPIYYSQIYRQLASDLYRHPGINRDIVRLGGNAGVRAVLRAALPHLLKAVSRYAELRFISRGRAIQLSSKYVVDTLAATRPGRIKELGMFIIPRATSNPLDNLNKLMNELTNALNKSFEEAASIDHITRALTGRKTLTWNDIVREATNKFIENIKQTQ